MPYTDLWDFIVESANKKQVNFESCRKTVRPVFNNRFWTEQKLSINAKKLVRKNLNRSIRSFFPNPAKQIKNCGEIQLGVEVGLLLKSTHPDQI